MIFPRPGEKVSGEDGLNRWILAVGDPPLGQIQYRFVLDGCPYIPWTESGLSSQEAVDYASRLVTRIYWTGTSNPAPGRTRVSITSHCGVVSVWADDVLWLADPALGDHGPPKGWDENVTHGFLVVVDSMHATFHGDGGQIAHFERAPAGAADPGSGCE